MNSAQVKEKNNPSLFSTDMISVYLKEIGKIPLLDHEEEIILGKQVQKMMSFLSEKQKLEQQKGEVVSQREWTLAVGVSEKELNQVLHQGKLAKTKMIKANLRLVVAIAKKYLKRNLEFLDLIQEGSLGLERGVEKFDPTKGYRFSTYAYWWIRQAMTRAIAQQGRTIRLPVHITEKLNKIKKAQRELALELGRGATTNEVAEKLGLTSSEVREYLKIAREPMSLDMRMGEKQDTELSEIIEDDSASPLDEINQRLMRQDVEKMLGELKPKEREVLWLRFGLFDGTEWTLQAIGEKLNISRERARQLQNRALANLKSQNIVALRDYLAS